MIEVALRHDHHRHPVRHRDPDVPGAAGAREERGGSGRRSHDHDRLRSRMPPSRKTGRPVACFGGQSPAGRGRRDRGSGLAEDAFDGDDMQPVTGPGDTTPGRYLYREAPDHATPAGIRSSCSARTPSRSSSRDESHHSGLSEVAHDALAHLIVAVYGLLFGSFINAWAWRLAHEESIAKGRSHCTSCGAPIRARDNVPVVSWLLLRGRCRDCERAHQLALPGGRGRHGGAVRRRSPPTTACPGSSSRISSSSASWCWSARWTWTSRSSRT